METKILNSIILLDKVIVSDPCYTRGTWCSGFLGNILEGEYIPIVTYKNINDWGLRVTNLIVVHNSVNFEDIKRWYNTTLNIGVDSGQAGIFCDTLYPYGDTGDWIENSENPNFYTKCCNATNGNQQEILKWESREERLQIYKQLSESLVLKETIRKEYLNNYNDLLNMKEPDYSKYLQVGTIDNKGVVSSSGFGDGSYSCYIATKKGKTIGIKIRYI